MAVVLCEDHIPENSVSEAETGLESETMSNALHGDEINDTQEAGEFQIMYNSEKYLFFVFGFVCGMLLVSIYFNFRGTALQSPTPKSLRRPEL